MDGASVIINSNNTSEFGLYLSNTDMLGMPICHFVTSMERSGSFSFFFTTLDVTLRHWSHFQRFLFLFFVLYHCFHSSGPKVEKASQSTKIISFAGNGIKESF